MPNEFIKYRFFFEKNGLIEAWGEQYTKLNLNERRLLIKILSGEISVDASIDFKVNNILKFYKITKYVAAKNDFNIYDLLVNTQEVITCGFVNT